MSTVSSDTVYETFAEYKNYLLSTLERDSSTGYLDTELLLPILNWVNAIPYLATVVSCAGHEKRDFAYLSVLCATKTIWSDLLRSERPEHVIANYPVTFVQGNVSLGRKYKYPRYSVMIYTKRMQEEDSRLAVLAEAVKYLFSEEE